MKRTAIILFVCAVSLWAGAMLFFSALVLPTLFMNLQVHEAGNLAALLFPKYNHWGTACSLLAAASALYLWLRYGLSWRTVAIVSLLVLAIQLYATLSLHPQVAALRGVDAPAARARFDHLHKRSVRVNGLLLLAELGLLVWCGRRVDPD